MTSKDIMKKYLEEMHTLKREISAGQESKDRTLSVAIADAICEVLDVDLAERGVERAQHYGFITFKERMASRRDHVYAAWATAQYDAMPIEQRFAVDRSPLGARILLQAESFDQVLSYVVVLGLNRLEMEQAMEGGTVWSDDFGTYVKSSMSSHLTTACGYFSYVALALGAEADKILGPSSLEMAQRLRESLGKINALGEAEHPGFNLGFLAAKRKSELMPDAKRRGRKSRSQATTEIESVSQVEVVMVDAAVKG